LSVGFYSSRRMRQAVSSLSAKARPDAFVIYSSSMAQYVPEEFAGRTVVDLVDVDSQKWRDYARTTAPPLSWLYRIEADRLFAYERAIAARFAETVVTTGREAALLEDGESAGSGSRIHSLKNGVDWRSFCPDVIREPHQALPAVERHLLPAATAPLLVFTGAMDYRANADGVQYFAREILPLVRSSHPDVRLLIVGSNPSPAVRRLGQEAGIIVTGSVADVRPYLAAATAAVVPLRVARGIQNKVIEAMAMGRAVIATPQAVAGLDVAAGEELLVGGTPEEFAGCVSRVIEDRRLREGLGARARAFVQREHNWEAMLHRFSELVASVAS
jgi:sugar transferase (PEP-CTERM/EpsH1 system associated)